MNVGFPEDGLKLAEAPLGRPDMLSVTGLEAPLVSVTVTDAWTLSPASMVPLLGLTETEKSN